MENIKSDNDSPKEKWLLHLYAFSVIIGFFAMCFLIALTKLDQSDHDILYMLLGVLGTTFSQVFQYYFGSSKK